MAIERWTPSEAFTKQEEMLLKRCKRVRKLFRFLRTHRLQIFDDDMQAELETMYRDTGAGKCPVPPALMAMATLLQGYMGVSDAEVVELTVVDLRWQMVLDRLGETDPAFSQGCFCNFRHRMIRSDMDRRLLERTREVAKKTKGFDYKKLPKDLLRVSMDSAPLEGAGRVEDTLNLLGHAARKVVECAAALLEAEADEVAREAGIPLLLSSSIKRGLDRVWTEPEDKEAAVEELTRQITSLCRWLEVHLTDKQNDPLLKEQIEILEQIVEQDLEPTSKGDGSMRIRQGVAKDRRISIEDGEMRHGRKSASKRIDGYKRHIAIEHEEDGDVVVMACAVTPANMPEREAVDSLNDDIEAQGEQIGELYIDRGYISSPVVSAILSRDGDVVCRPWRPRNGKLFAKNKFTMDFETMTLTCPAGQTAPMKLGSATVFPKEACQACPLRQQCTTAEKRGRSVYIGENEPLQQELRDAAKTPEGRERLRQRVRVEHSLAHVVQRQGRRARYMGARNNLFDLRRACAIQNLEVAQRSEARAAAGDQMAMAA